MTEKKKKEPTTISIKNVKKFVAPLKNLARSVDSIVMSVKDETINVNTRSEDSSQVANILFTTDVVSVTGDMQKFGIYNLNEFISVLTMSDAKALELVVNDNVLTIQYGENDRIDYMLSDLSLITEGPIELKAKVEFLATFDINSSFIKKVKGISNTIGATVLKLQAKDNVLSYSIVNKNAQSHSYTSKIGDVECADFDVSISIRDDKRDNLGFLTDGVNYLVSVNPKIIKLEGTSEEGEDGDGEKVNNDLSYGMLRYFIAPLAV